MGVQDDYVEAWNAGRNDERERAAQVVEMRAQFARVSAARLRGSGTYTSLILRRERIRPYWEMRARDMDAVARAFEVVALCIRSGHDPRGGH